MGVPQPQRVPKSRKVNKPVSESRKVRKPLMEKRRRDRINACLTSLSSLLLNAGGFLAADDESTLQLQSGSKKSRLEKADILEQTVQHWHQLDVAKLSRPSKIEGQRPYPDSESEDSPFVMGFKGCMEVIDELLLLEMPTEGGASFADFRDDLQNHLQNQLNQLTPAPSEEATDCETDDASESSQDSNGDAVLTFLPRRLPSGDFALVMQEIPAAEAEQIEDVSAASGCHELAAAENNSQKSSAIFNFNNHSRVKDLALDDDASVWRPF